ncbi:MAG: 4Fe-4S binding protein [Theionarchaea archaeon]|nr:4Fe-4S binding protein [Theionarchaea archaeon]
MNDTLQIHRDEKRCVGCGECIIVCPQSGEDNPESVIISAQEPGAPPEINCIENCIQCMTCWDFCRSNAIIFENHHLVPRLVEDTAMLAKVFKFI